MCDGCGDFTTCLHPYVPDDITISWTDYNWPDEFNQYFYGYPETIKQHKSETIKIKGWLCIPIAPNQEDTASAYAYSILDSPDQVPNIVSKTGVPVRFNGESFRMLKDNYEEWRDRLVYITGCIDYYASSTPGCLHLCPVINAVEINIIPEI